MKIRIAYAADVADMFRIRLCVNENKTTMVDLAKHGITPESLPDMLMGQGRGWVVELDGVVAAFAMADARHATIFALFVDPAFEGRGMGRKLMSVAEKWLAEQGCTQAWLETDSDAAVRANGFYRHIGWIESTMQPDGQVKFIKNL